jgi:hypothetical protein
MSKACPHGFVSVGWLLVFHRSIAHEIHTKESSLHLISTTPSRVSCRQPFSWVSCLLLQSFLMQVQISSQAYFHILIFSYKCYSPSCLVHLAMIWVLQDLILRSFHSRTRSSSFSFSNYTALHCRRAPLSFYPDSNDWWVLGGFQYLSATHKVQWHPCASLIFRKGAQNRGFWLKG